jgi:hypothetical protein
MGNNYFVTEEGAIYCRKVVEETYINHPETAEALSKALGGSIEESLPHLKMMEAEVGFVDPLRRKYAVFVNGHVMKLVDEDNELALYQGELLAGSVRRLSDSEGEIWFEGGFVASYVREGHKYTVTNTEGDKIKRHPLDYLLDRPKMGFLSLSPAEGGEVSLVPEEGRLSLIVKKLFGKK